MDPEQAKRIFDKCDKVNDFIIKKFLTLKSFVMTVTIFQFWHFSLIYRFGLTDRRVSKFAFTKISFSILSDTVALLFIFTYLGYLGSSPPWPSWSTRRTSV
jgi:hypothetical protein